MARHEHRFVVLYHPDACPKFQPVITMKKCQHCEHSCLRYAGKVPMKRKYDKGIMWARKYFCSNCKQISYFCGDVPKEEWRVKEYARQNKFTRQNGH